MDIKVKIEVPGLTEAIQKLADAFASVNVNPIKGSELRDAASIELRDALADTLENGAPAEEQLAGELPAESLASAKIEAAKIEVPEAEPEKTKPAKAKAEAKAKAKASKAEEAPAIDLKVVREKLAAKTQEGKQAQIKELIAKFGVKKLSEVPKEKYAELLELAEEL
ncbi:MULTISPECIES: hypothetical protein [Bacillus]|uniref:hypothetical protein n=1 Tax=Bacillus TaxID=1386 RepID=UPI00228295DB|nr:MULTISPECIES: hypothetical protein [Bacillus]MCY8180863.1 hypothetical protein [Bacillus paralicheniformis]MCY8664850.1 hypothetical protein [Bacillus haynesii]MCY8712438.1 hypothetical protein [Bacillus haynesii]